MNNRNFVRHILSFSLPSNRGGVHNKKLKSTFLLTCLSTLTLMFSEFEGKFEDTNGSVPPPACLPIASCSGSSENHDMEAVAVENTETAVELHVSHDHAQPGDASDLNYLQEQVGGMLKITPSDVEVSHILALIEWRTNHLGRCYKQI